MVGVIIVVVPVGVVGMVPVGVVGIVPVVVVVVVPVPLPTITAWVGTAGENGGPLAV